MKKQKVITSIVTVLMLGGVATSVSACRPAWRNNFAYVCKYFRCYLLFQ